MKSIIVLLSIIFTTYSQSLDTTTSSPLLNFNPIMDSALQKTSTGVNKEHAKDIKVLTPVDSSTECDKEAVAATINQYQQQLHNLQQATFELSRDQLAHYRQNSFNNSMAIVSVGVGIVAGVVAVSNVLHEKAYKTPVIEISLAVGLIAEGLSRFIKQW